jgi:predicted transcriptional regulator
LWKKISNRSQRGTRGYGGIRDNKKPHRIRKEGKILKKFLESLLEEKAPGPYLSLSIFHLIKTLELIAKEGPIGRGKLSEELKTGEGAVRTLIERLKKAGLITVSKKGCFLAEIGETIWSKMQLLFPQKVKIEPNELTLAKCNVAIRVRGCGDKVRSGLEQRDAALLAGAKGAVTFLLRGQKLVLPTISEDVAKEFPDAYKKITKGLLLEENDALVIGSADAWDKAEYGAIAAAWSLIKNDGYTANQA